jgi:hypothetical protein
MLITIATLPHKTVLEQINFDPRKPTGSIKNTSQIKSLMNRDKKGERKKKKISWENFHGKYLNGGN